MLSRFHSLPDEQTDRQICMLTPDKIVIFDKYIALSRKRYKIGPYLLCNANRNSYATYRVMSFPMNGSEP